MYLLRSDQVEPQPVTQAVGASWGFSHVWSPDSQLVVVPVVDGDFNVVNTDRALIAHRPSVGAIAGFVDHDSLGWVSSEGSRGDQGLLVFSTTDGALIHSYDTTGATSDLACPLHWQSGSAQLPRVDEVCAIEPG